MRLAEDQIDLKRISEELYSEIKEDRYKSWKKGKGGKRYKRVKKAKGVKRAWYQKKYRRKRL